MNKKGQSLVTFILFLPIIVFFLAFFIDSSLMYYTKNKLEGVITDNMKSSLKKEIYDTHKIKEVIEANDQDLKVDVLLNGDNLIVIGKGTKKNLFGKVITLDVYKLEFQYCGNYQSKIVKECKGDY